MLIQHSVAGGQSSDLLAVFDSIRINAEKISAEDKQVCEQLQLELYKVLNQLNEWYLFFKDKGNAYQDIYRLYYKEDGSVRACDDIISENCENSRFIQFEFIPFKMIEHIVTKYNEAINFFSDEVISYFNNKYHISVPKPDNDKRVVWGFRPSYQYLVDFVFNYLGKNNFREVAESEIIDKFHNVTTAWKDHLPFRKDDKIIFPKIIVWNEYYKENRLIYNSLVDIKYFSAGIALATNDTLDGSPAMIIGFNANNIDLSRWYELTTDKAKMLKFYKNGRIDVKFKDKQTAEECFLRLKLDQFKPKDKNE